MMKLIQLRNKISGLTTAIIFGITLSGIASTLSAAELSVNVKDIRKIEGHLMVALFKGKADYENGKAVKSQRVKVDKDSHIIVFKDIPDGDYAIKLYHDDNDNNEMDSNMFGIPKEGYGFSNNGGRFGPPNFDDARIVIEKSILIEITLL